MTVVAGALSLTGCTQDTVARGAGEDEATVARDPDDSTEGDLASDVSRVERALVTILVDGDLTFEWEAEQDLRIVTITPSEQAVNLFSVGFEAFQPIGNAEADHFRWAFDVSGGYEGPGTYLIPGATDGEGQGNGEDLMSGAARSGAFLLHVQLEDPEREPLLTRENVESTSMYDGLVQSCTVEVSDAEQTGSLTCPALVNADGGTISLHVVWELIAP